MSFTFRVDGRDTTESQVAKFSYSKTNYPRRFEIPDTLALGAVELVKTEPSIIYVTLRRIYTSV